MPDDLPDQLEADARFLQEWLFPNQREIDAICDRLQRAADELRRREAK